jgi:FKBP-type peptidyl-prolyl cis-trans isomerase FkpA/FKBP-type peptidyl-prolyl cis-trans isomerase FklB
MKSCCYGVAGVVGAALLTGLIGCEGLSDPPGKQAPIAKAPAQETGEPLETENLKPKKAPLPKLPEGAGEMDADAPEELTPTASGLYYRILRKSDGKKPLPTDSVSVDYLGTFDDGSKFDGSYGKGQPAEFEVGRVIKGWTEGLQLIGEGGMIELEIPYKLAYGESGRPPKIPPKARLHFLVELRKVK